MISNPYQHVKRSATLYFVNSFCYYMDIKNGTTCTGTYLFQELYFLTYGYQINWLDDVRWYLLIIYIYIYIYLGPVALCCKYRYKTVVIRSRYVRLLKSIYLFKHINFGRKGHQNIYAINKICVRAWIGPDCTNQSRLLF